MTTVNKKGKKLEKVEQSGTLPGFSRTLINDSFDLNTYTRLYNESLLIGLGSPAGTVHTGTIQITLGSNFYVGANGIVIDIAVDQDPAGGATPYSCSLYLNGTRLYDLPNNTLTYIEDFRNTKILRTSYENIMELRYTFQQRIFGTASWNTGNFRFTINGFWF